MPRADGGPEPGEERRRGTAKRPHRRLDHAAGEPPPAGMGRGHRLARVCREQHRQAVGGENGADAAGPARQGRVRRAAGSAAQ